MDSSPRALQIDEKIFFKFRIRFRIIGRKIIKIIASVNIDQSAMCYLSMDSSRQALQTHEKFFFQISESFFELTTCF